MKTSIHPKTVARWGVALAALIAAASLLPVSAAHAGSAILVTSTADDLIAGDGLCTLREAIHNANSDGDTTDGDCAIGNGDDVITLPAGVYTLAVIGAGEDGNASGDLDITSNLTMSGAGVGDTTIDGGALDRVLHIHGGTIVEISGLTITNGETPRGANGGDGDDGEDGESSGAGGGIYNGGTLTIVRCAIGGNATASGGSGGDGGHGGYGGNGGFGGNGGGIYNAGTLTIVNSAVADNTTGLGGAGGSGDYDGDDGDDGSGGDGGGIYNSGALTIVNSAISGNVADGYLGDGGGIYSSGTLTITNSTVSSNSASGEGYAGGIYNHAGETALTNSTISNNQSDGYVGGVYNDYGTLTAKNTIIASNTALAGGADCEGVLESQDYNLIENATHCSVVGAVAHNIVGDPKLGPLADNGGDTWTHFPQPDSPIIDAGSCISALADQRGYPRPSDSQDTANADDGCDIGAVEVSPRLALAKVVDDPTPLRGHRVTYTITIVNSGDVTATNVLISDPLSDDLTLAGPAALDPPDAGTVGTPPTVAHDVIIPAGESVTITLPVTVNISSVAHGAIITNTAVVTSAEVSQPVADEITMTALNVAPAFTGSPVLTATEDALYGYSPTVDDVNGDPLSFSLDANPTWLSVDTATGTLHGTPRNDDVGPNHVVLQVSDGISTTQQSFTITVINTNDAPTVSDFAKSGEEDGTLTFDEADFGDHFSDVDAGDALAAAKITSLPGHGTLTLGAGIDVTVNQIIAVGELGDLVYTPDADYNGADDFTWSGSDGQAYAVAPATVALTITPANDPPLFTSTPVLSATEDVLYQYILAADDLDGDTLAWDAVVHPAWLALAQPDHIRTIVAQNAVGVAVDGAGNAYVADHEQHCVFVTDIYGVTRTVAGICGEVGYSGDGGPATSARLNQPYDVALDDAGNVYIADRMNHRIRKIDPSGVISTIAGMSTSGYNGDGRAATIAQLNEPRGVAVDSAASMLSFLSSSW
jgi:uncharacterized repeat protein (TIGR01451 family)/CSLREA domain-containing protein